MEPFENFGGGSVRGLHAFILIRFAIIAILVRYALFLMPAWLAAQPAFEAAVVKPADPAANGFMTRWTQSQVELRNCSLRQCIETAYDLRDYALSGPAWLDSVHFDIVAKLPSGSSQGQFHPMLQTLLAERFGLKVHPESREVPGYVVTVAKGGPKFLRSGLETTPSTSSGPSMVRCRAATMAIFVDQLSRNLGRPVADETSLDGTFDFDLHWTPDDAPVPGPSLFAAVQEQLGLKLQAQKAPVTIVVVDGINRVPTGN